MEKSGQILDRAPTVFFSLSGVKNNDAKNAIQADPVATGPSDSRYVNKAYVGDLDGKVWRFDLDLDSSKNPKFTGSPLALYTPASSAQPIFSSMAAVSVGTQEYLFVGTGGTRKDCLP